MQLSLGLHIDASALLAQSSAVLSDDEHAHAHAHAHAPSAAQTAALAAADLRVRRARLARGIGAHNRLAEHRGALGAAEIERRACALEGEVRGLEEWAAVVRAAVVRRERRERQAAVERERERAERGYARMRMGEEERLRKRGCMYAPYRHAGRERQREDAMDVDG